MTSYRMAITFFLISFSIIKCKPDAQSYDATTNEKTYSASSYDQPGIQSTNTG